MDTLPTVPKKSSKKKAKKSKSHSSEQSLAKMLTAYTDSLHRLEAQRPDPDVWMSDRRITFDSMQYYDHFNPSHMLVLYPYYYIRLQLLLTATSGCSGLNWLK
jgi:hypothetical protein